MNLVKTISSYIQIPEEEAERLIDISTHKKIPKGGYFIRAGEKPAKLAIVLSGLFRYLYIDDEGNEYTKAFMPASRFLSAYSSMISGDAAYFFIEALEDSEILEFSYENWLALKASNDVWKELLIRMLEIGYSIKERRERDLLLLDAETRYINFCREHPELVKRVKQHQIASYLGIKPESLSRLKKMADLT